MTGFTTPQTIYSGQFVTYQATSTGSDAVATYKWEYQGSNGQTTTAWYDTGVTGATYAVEETIPGGYNIKLTVTYQKNSGGVTPPETVIVNAITVIGPTSDTITAGLGMDFDAFDGGRHVVQFNFMNGMQQIYVSTITLAEEQINFRYPPPVRTSDWSGEEPGGDQNAYPFSWTSTFISDAKSFDPGFTNAQYAALDNGYLLSNMVQTNRITYTDSCGNAVIVTFQPHRLERTKSGNTTFQLNEY